MKWASRFGEPPMFSRFWAHAAFILVSLAPLAAAPPALAQAELNWPSKQFVRPREVALAYPCGGGATCDLQSFMNRQHVCALLIVKDGAIVFQQTLVRGDDDPCKSPVERDRFGIASIAKSLVGLLFGFVYADESFAPPVALDQKAADLLGPAGVEHYDPRVTLRQLLTMSTGMDWSEDEIDTWLKINVDQNGDLVGEYRKLKDAAIARLDGAKFLPPGKFHYSGFDTQLIGILTEARLTPDRGFTRGSLDEALEKFIWQKLPMQKAAEWNADFAGRPAAHCCLYTSARDLATLGDFVLKEYSQGSGAVAQWIRASVSDTVDAGWRCAFEGTRKNFRFGYQWWAPSDDVKDGFAAIGTEGQYLHMFPEQDVVVVQLSEKLASDSDTCEAMLVHRLIADTISQP
jgi:CubicO group peptidase (beta-lactamase class C family)